MFVSLSIAKSSNPTEDGMMIAKSKTYKKVHQKWGIFPPK